MELANYHLFNFIFTIFSHRFDSNKTTIFENAKPTDNSIGGKKFYIL
jgi:hypothetical protein